MFLKSPLNSVGGVGTAGGVGQILAWVVWVHKTFSWVEKLLWVKNNINILYVPFLYSKNSLHVFVPDIRLFVSLMSISYSNWPGPKIKYRP